MYFVNFGKVCLFWKNFYGRDIIHRSRSRSCHWQVDSEGGTLAGSRFHFDGAAVPLDDAERRRQSPILAL